MITHEVFLDIETYPEIPDHMIEILRREIRAPKNIKDPEKIETAIKKKEEALIEKAALSPLTAAVCTVALAWRPVDSASDPQVSVRTTEDDSEIDLLVTLDEKLATLRTMRVITYNGARFDLPFLAARAMHHALTLRWPWPIGRYNPLHVDMFDVLGEGSLEKWNILLGGAPKEIGGGQIAEMIDAGKWDQVEEHCADDVRMLCRIYDRYKMVVQPKGR